MRRIAGLLVLLTIFPWSTPAAQILGTIRENGRPVAGVNIEVSCPANPSDIRRATTDQYGAYSVNVTEKGKCTFTAIYSGQRASTDVFSYADPVRADFDITRSPSGATLKRR